MLAGAGAWAAAVAPASWAQFRIEISGVGATQLPIAVATFRQVGEPPPADVAAIVRANLERSGVFRASSPPAAIDETTQPSLPEWRAQNVDALVAGTVQRGGDGRFEVRYKLWDTVRNEELLGRSRLVLAADLRLAAHKIADEIHLKLTGERAVNATRIAYVLRQGKRYTLNITDADGENGQVALASSEAIISPAWAPDGRQLAYVSFETGKAAVWVQDVLSGQRRMVANFRGSNSAPAFSPDGRTLAVALSQGGLTQLHSIPAAGGAATRLTNSNAIDTEPVYSADGRFIYFVSDRGGGPQIYRIEAAGGPATRITFEGDYNISPSLSPDGRLLAFVGRQGSAFRLMTQELDGGSVRTLTDTRDDERPSFAPNGRLIVYATRMQGADTLMTTTLDGKIKTRLATSGADMREPAWGPFGEPDAPTRR
ncbi:MAG: Tol-Pal system beta propeller repeat protein TolB [Rubrivivax sp.]|nr:Tol-Pal system beta propeller repeat protein TolB [Rubrivivax sp.]